MRPRPRRRLQWDVLAGEQCKLPPWLLGRCRDKSCPRYSSETAVETPVAPMKVMGNGESAPWGSFQLLGALSHIRSASDGGFHGHGAARQQERKCAMKPGA